MRGIMESRGPLQRTIDDMHNEQAQKQAPKPETKRGQTVFLVEKRRERVRSKGCDKLKWLLPTLILSAIMAAACIYVGLFIEPLPSCHLKWPQIFEISGIANLIVTIATGVLMASVMSLAMNRTMLKETVYHEQGRDNEFISAIDEDPESTLATCRAALCIYLSGFVLFVGVITLVGSSIWAISTGIIGNGCGKMAKMYFGVFFTNVAANVLSQGLVFCVQRDWHAKQDQEHDGESTSEVE